MNCGLRNPGHARRDRGGGAPVCAQGRGISQSSAATAEAFEAEPAAEVTATSDVLLDALRAPGGSRRRPSRRCADPMWLARLAGSR